MYTEAYFCATLYMLRNMLADSDKLSLTPKPF